MLFTIHKNLQFILGTISATRLFGFIPLGMILHITITTLISIFLLRRGMKFKHVFIIVFFIGLSKEILDSFVLNNTLQKHILDMCYNLSFLTLIYLRDKLKIFIKKLKMKN